MHPIGKTDAATIAAWAGAAGVVAGAIITSVGVAFRELAAGRREREARAALRQAQLADQRAAFQRDTIIALQDAAGEVAQAAWRGMRSPSLMRNSTSLGRRESPAPLRCRQGSRWPPTG